MKQVSTFLLSGIDDDTHFVVRASDGRRLFCSEPFESVALALDALRALKVVAGESVCRLHERRPGGFACVIEPSLSMRIGHCGPFQNAEELEWALDELAAGIDTSPVRDLTAGAPVPCAV